MGTVGIALATAFFFLMTIAALTSSISILEVPVAFIVERFEWSRKQAALVAGGSIASLSAVIILDFERLFGAVIALSTRYGQPLLGLLLCVFVGWVWQRNTLLAELQKNDPEVANGLFWRIWPVYVRFVCPVIIAVIFYRSLV